MKALCWHGKSDIRCDTVPDPEIQSPRDAIIKVTACAICGSDLHIFNGVIPEMEQGDIIGHETMGEVVEVGPENKKLKVGDRVVVPFTIACGECFFCQHGFFSGCERSNPDKQKAEKSGVTRPQVYLATLISSGVSPAVRPNIWVPYADVGPIKIPMGFPMSRSFPLGHFSDRVYGCRLLQHKGRRNDCHLGMRPCWAVRHQECVPLGSRPRNSDRHCSRKVGTGPPIRRGNSRFQER